MRKRLLILLCSATCTLAADKIPKEMRPKLIKDGTLVIDEKFSTPELDKKWLVPRGELAGSVKMIDGVAEIDSGTGRQGAIWQKLPEGVTDAGVQVLLQPTSVNGMGLRFLAANPEAQRSWKIAVIIYSTGFVRAVVPDGTKLKVIKSAKIDLTRDDWWRIYVESKGDKLNVRVNGEDLFQIDTPETEGPKTGFMVNLYGGKGLVDDIHLLTAP